MTQTQKSDDRKHAILSASSANTWLNCPVSARLQEHFFKDESSAYADEGTLAHQLGAELLEGWQADCFDEASYEQIAEIYDAEMAESLQTYVDTCIELAGPVVKNDPATIIQIEKRLDFSAFVPNGFGTCDFLICGGNELKIIDFKYGKGVPVNAEKNPQLMLYAVGALLEYADIFDTQYITLCVVQPRLHNISKSYTSAVKLLQWARDIREPAHIAFAGEGLPKTGKHCRFCRVQPRCKAFQQELEQRMTQDCAELMSDEEISFVVLRSKALIGWINKVEEYALKKAVGGYAWPHLKLVAGRGKRQIIDEDAVKKELLRAGFEESEIMKKPEMLGLTALAKLCGPAKLDELIGYCIDKAPGKPTLVAESDARDKLIVDNTDDMFDDSML